MKAELSSRNHIVMLNRELLHPHPDNPRKDLGDTIKYTPDEVADILRKKFIGGAA